MTDRLLTIAPVYEDEFVTLYHGDALELLPALIADGLSVDACITDPPYGDTSLDWDTSADTVWLDLVAEVTSTVWCFGSMRFHMEQAPAFRAAGWRLAQDVVWEKHTGSGFATDRFKRVHEHAVQWYRGGWAALHHDTPTTMVYGIAAPPGGIVLDPFAGSCSTLLAAREQRKRAIGIEAEERYCTAAVKRLCQMEMAA